MNKTETTYQFGNLLRYWRQQRGKSQLDLSLDAGVSQRHISFVESGRSIPSRDLILSLSGALDVPIRDRNVLLNASGYAPIYAEGSLDAPEMAMINMALNRVLEQHEPHPAIVIDRYWYVLKTNKAAPKFFGSFVDLSKRKTPRNILDLMFDPDGMRPFIEDWEAVASGLLQRVYRESVGHVIDEKTKKLLDHLLSYPGVKKLKSTQRSDLPVIPITFVKGSKKTTYFSLVSTVGTPNSVASQEMRIECMFPMEKL